MKVCPCCGKSISDSESYLKCSICKRNYHLGCRCPAHPDAIHEPYPPRTEPVCVRVITPPLPSNQGSVSEIVNNRDRQPVGVWKAVITTIILGIGMSWLSSTVFPSPEKEIKMYSLLTMFILSFSGSMAYILTRIPIMAFLIQASYMTYQLFFAYGDLFLFSIIQSIILSVVFSKLERTSVQSRVIIGNVCIGVGIVILALIARNWQVPTAEVALEWLAVFLSYAFAALVAIILGKIFRRC